MKNPINRYLSEQNLTRFKSDFGNLIKITNSSGGVIDIAIRNDYLNVYFEGNSLAKISFKARGSYEVRIHEKFFDSTRADSPEFYSNKDKSGNYVVLMLDSEKRPRRFFQKRHISQFSSRIRKVNYGGEITFEQALIADNLNRDDLIIIDRQVTDTGLKRKRMDLLALKQVKSRKYQFLVLEVKLGNNPELKHHVAMQLDGYIKHIEDNFISYKICYEKHYAQKKMMGLVTNPSFDAIEIIEQVKGLVVVGGYTKMAQDSIAELKIKYPNIQIKQYVYTL